MAVMFFTRIPVPSLPDFREADLTNAARWFSAVGLLVGGIQLMVLGLAAMALPPLAAALLALTAGLLLTGAFHEDGLADSFDGLGGGYTPARVLDIMKDSRIGTFGAAALILALALQAVALAELVAWPATLLAAHAISRFAAVTLLATQAYVREDAQSRAKPLATRIGAAPGQPAGAAVPVRAVAHGGRHARGHAAGTALVGACLRPAAGWLHGRPAGRLSAIMLHGRAAGGGCRALRVAR